MSGWLGATVVLTPFDVARWTSHADFRSSDELSEDQLSEMSNELHYVWPHLSVSTTGAQPSFIDGELDGMDVQYPHDLLEIGSAHMTIQPSASAAPLGFSG